jgi:hypothetical protein
MVDSDCVNVLALGKKDSGKSELLQALVGYDSANLELYNHLIIHLAAQRTNCTGSGCILFSLHTARQKCARWCGRKASTQQTCSFGISFQASW